jgi:hypothetical protein
VARQRNVVHVSLPRLPGSARHDTRAGSGGDEKPGAFLPFIYALIGNLVIAWTLSGVLGHLGPGQVTLRNGVISAAFLWFGFILTTMAVNYSFSGRDTRLLVIDLCNWLIVLVVSGAVIGAMGV